MCFQRTRQKRIFSTIVHYSNFAVKQAHYNNILDRVEDFKFSKVNCVRSFRYKKYCNYFHLLNSRISSTPRNWGIRRFHAGNKNNDGVFSDEVGWGAGLRHEFEKCEPIWRRLTAVNTHLQHPLPSPIQ